MTPSVDQSEPRCKRAFGATATSDALDVLPPAKPTNWGLPADELLGWLAEGLKQLFFCIDMSDGRLLYLSEGCEGIWGRTRESLHADPRSLRDTVVPEDRARVDQVFEPWHRNGERYEVEYRIRWPDGSVRWVRERGVTMKDEFGIVNRVIGHAVDKTTQHCQSDEATSQTAVRQPPAAGTIAGAATRPLRVMIAEGRPLISRGLASVLRRHDICVNAEVDSSTEALNAWQRDRPDVLLLDQDLPASGALPLLREIRRRDANVRVVLLGRSDQENTISAGLRCGARAFLSSTTSEAEVLHCIRLVHAGQTFVSQSVAMLITSHMSCDPLTTRELEILSHVADGRSNKRIARTLAIAETTVKSHVHKILGKTSTSSRTEAAAMALRRGLVAPPR